MASLLLALDGSDIRSDLAQVPARCFDPAGENPAKHGQRLKSSFRRRDVLRDRFIVSRHVVLVVKGTAVVGETG